MVSLCIVLELLKVGDVDVIVFVLLNKFLLYLVGMIENDEMVWFEMVFDDGIFVIELNIFLELVMGCVISYCLIFEVVDLIIYDFIVECGELFE